MSGDCPECGGERVYHGIEYLAVILDHLALPFSIVFRQFKRGSRAPGRINIVLCTLCVSLGIGKFLYEPDEKTLLLDQMLWKAAEKRGIRMREFRLLGKESATFIASLPAGEEYYFCGVLLPPNRKVWWVNHKGVLRGKLRSCGIPVARGGVTVTRKGARKLFESLGAPVVVKPVIGSASRHTTMHIGDLKSLQQAFRSAKRISPIVVIEEELRGQVYRPTLVGGELLGTLRRDQPYVMGDDTHTVAELIAIANTDPKRGGPYFSPITLANETERELAIQELTTTSIPKIGQRVQLHPKINWALGGTTTDVTDSVHPDNRALFEKIAQLLHTPLLGIDFIIEDISRSWREQERCGVIECNDLPYFDNHHLPFSGEPRDIAGPMWDLFLSAKERSEYPHSSLAKT